MSYTYCIDKNKIKFDAIIVGAGAAGLMAAISAAGRGKTILLLEHSSKIAAKISISGGGRCNFTNINASSENYICANPFFPKSALANYSPSDFLQLMAKHKISYHEKKLGQLFCDHGAQAIIQMLLDEISRLPVQLLLNTKIQKLEYKPEDDLPFNLADDKQSYVTSNLIIASGGLSIPKIGASDFGYNVAKQFGINIVQTFPALVPLIFDDSAKYNRDFFAAHAGLSFYAQVSLDKPKISFSENILFTHKGLSGPAILQISSYWQEGQSICVNLAPHLDIYQYLIQAKKSQAKQKIFALLKAIKYPNDLLKGSKLNRQVIFTDDFLKHFCDLANISNQAIAELSNDFLKTIAKNINQWTLEPAGTEGYAKAEVTLGGIDTRELNSKTMESKKIPGLYFIGEVVDVTGWLGGYNFQWAWASGFVAGQAIM